MMKPMDDNDVRVAVLEWLDGDLDLDELEDVALANVGVEPLADAVLHAVSTREQFSDDEFRQLMLTAADVVDALVVATRVASPTPTMAVVIDFREHQARRTEFTWSADTERGRAHA